METRIQWKEIIFAIFRHIRVNVAQENFLLVSSYDFDCIYSLSGEREKKTMKSRA